MALTSYLTATRRILRDATSSMWLDPELIDYINEARVQTVNLTSCTRILLSKITLSQAVENYQYSTVTNVTITGYSVIGTTLTVTFSSPSAFAAGFTITISGATAPASLNGIWGIAAMNATLTQATIALTTAQALALTGVLTGAPVAALNIMNVMDIYVYFNSLRPALDRMSFSGMSRRFRPYVGFQDYPKAFATYQQSVYIAPLPFENLPSDWDVVPFPMALVTDDTFDAIPAIYRTPIPFYAAYRAYLTAQDFAKAGGLFDQFLLQCRFSTKSQFPRSLRHGTFR